MSVTPEQRAIYERYKPAMDAAEADRRAWMLANRYPWENFYQAGHRYQAHRAKKRTQELRAAIGRSSSTPICVVTPLLVSPDRARQDALDRSAAHLIRGGE
jgi:hypothetical protein